MKLVALLALAAVAYAQGGAVVAGKALNSANGAGVAEVTIVLQGLDPSGNPPQPDSYIAETDGEGAFRVEGVTPGRYTVAVRREGFAAPSATTRLKVEPGVAPAPLTLRLTPLCAVSGRITDPDGDPIAEAVVTAQVQSWIGGTRRWSTATSARTDDRGEYRLFGLRPGRYVLRASRAYGSVGASSRSMPTRGPKADHVYGATYFPASPDAAGASELPLAPGADVRNIGIQLRPESLYRIRVRAVGVTGGGGREVTFSVTDVTGDGPAISFSFSGPAYDRPASMPPAGPGKYLVAATDRTRDMYAQQLVTVTNQDVEVTLSLAPMIALSGMVRVQGAAGAALDAVRLRMDAEEPWGRGGEGPVRADGGFSIAALLPAAYRLRATLPAGVYLKSIRRGDRVLPTPRLDLSESAAPLVVTLGTDGGVIEGVAAEGVEIVLVPQGALREWLDLQRTFTAGKDGRFELRDIAPGDYLLFAFDGAESGAPEAAEFRRPYGQQATAVSIAAASRQTVTVQTISPQP